MQPNCWLSIPIFACVIFSYLWLQRTGFSRFPHCINFHMQRHLICRKTGSLRMCGRNFFLRKVGLFLRHLLYFITVFYISHTVLVHGKGCFTYYVLFVRSASVPFSGLRRGDSCPVWLSQMSWFLEMRACTATLPAFSTGCFFEFSICNKQFY